MDRSLDDAIADRHVWLCSAWTMAISTITDWLSQRNMNRGGRRNPRRNEWPRDGVRKVSPLPRDPIDSKPRILTVHCFSRLTSSSSREPPPPPPHTRYEHLQAVFLRRPAPVVEECA